MRQAFLMEDTELETIRRAAARVLDETGVVIDHVEALQLLEAHGARVDWPQRRAWLPEPVIAQALGTVPAAFTLAGSDPAHDVTLALDGPPHGRPVVGADFVVDPGSRQPRPCTLRDTELWVRLVDRLPHVQINSGPYPSDVPEAVRDLLLVERALELGHKPAFASHYTGEALRWSLELMALLPDRGHTRLMVYVSCNSPLHYAETQTDILLTAARNGVAVAINSAPLAGATAPFTMAGWAAQITAELLTGVVLAQLARPGAPMIWSPLLLVFDMRTTIAASGYAQDGLMHALMGQLGKSYRIPTHCLGLVTDAVIPDAQAIMEKVLVAYPALLGRPALVGGAGGLSAYLGASMEQLVLDDDLLGGMFCVLQGIHLDEEALAAEAIQRVGPGGHFLEDKHTRKYLRSEYYPSLTANRLSPEMWLAEGGLDLRARAAQRMNQLLAAPQEPVVAEEVVREMRHIVQRAQEKAS